MSMMYSAGLMFGLMAFLIVLIGGILIAVRLYGGHEVRDDHPR